MSKETYIFWNFGRKAHTHISRKDIDISKRNLYIYRKRPGICMSKETYIYWGQKRPIHIEETYKYIYVM